MRPDETIEMPTRCDVYLNVQSSEIRFNKFPSSIDQPLLFIAVKHTERDDKMQFLLTNVYRLSQYREMF